MLLALAAGCIGAKIATKAITNTVIAISNNLPKKKETVKETVIVKEMVQEAPPPAPMPVQRIKVSGRCRGCRAPLSDYTDTFVRCEYCDTEQVLTPKEAY